MTNRTYNQYCGLAYALDIVGERWTLLIIRELVAGPRRFSDLLSGLPDISTNLLSERLKRLEQHGMVRRRTLPRPASVAVYELTDIAKRLEPTLLELGRWGSQFVPPSPGHATVLHLGSYALTLKTFFRAELAADLDEIYALQIDDEVLRVHIRHGTIDVEQGETRGADMVLRTDMPTYLGLLSGAVTPRQALEQGIIEIQGNQQALNRLLAICGLPASTGPA